MKIFISVFLLFICITPNSLVWGSQQIETIQFPSEDEIAEAYNLGEINLEQFLILTELISNGIENTSFLLDEIPQSLLKFDTTNLEQSFISLQSSRTPHFLLQNQYASYIEEDTRYRNQSSVTYTNKELLAQVTIKREYLDRERFTRRFIAYNPEDKNYNFIFGNFIKRFGLGGLIGYRGKVLSYTDVINKESLLFPDFGGFNGLYFQSKNKALNFEFVTSYNRNAEYSLLTSGTNIELQNSIYPSLITAVNKFKNKLIDKNFDDLKISLYKKFDLKNVSTSFEIGESFNKQKNSYFILSDGLYSASQVKLRYSFWSYGDSFYNFSGGGKTSVISEYEYIESIDYNMLNKRSNQTGAILKSQFALSYDLLLDIATLYAYKNKDSTETELYGQLSKSFVPSLELSVDFLHRIKIRLESMNDVPQKKTQSRFKMKYENNNMYVRNFLSVLKYADSVTYAGFFTDIKLHTANYGIVQLWLNASHFNTTTHQLDYFYAFIRNEFEIQKTISFAFKVSHSYNRTATTRNSNQFSFDISWRI